MGAKLQSQLQLQLVLTRHPSARPPAPLAEAVLPGYLPDGASRRLLERRTNPGLAEGCQDSFLLVWAVLQLAGNDHLVEIFDIGRSPSLHDCPDGLERLSRSWSEHPADVGAVLGAS